MKFMLDINHIVLKKIIISKSNYCCQACSLSVDDGLGLTLEDFILLVLLKIQFHRIKKNVTPDFGFVSGLI